MWMVWVAEVALLFVVVKQIPQILKVWGEEVVPLFALAMQIPWMKKELGEEVELRSVVVESG